VATISDIEALDEVWRRESPHVLGALIRRYGDFDACEDAVAEAVVAATKQWPNEGAPDNPRGWLIRVASRRYIDAVRSDRARVDRERADAARSTPDERVVSSADDPPLDTDDTLRLLYLCCHPELPRPSQVALTLRAVVGLTTSQIAAAFLVPTATMAKRISRAKELLRDREITFDEQPVDGLSARTDAVLHVLYLVFNEGYTASGGDQLLDVSLTREAIRLVRELQQRLRGNDEATGLLALMLLTEARVAARADEHGDLVPLADQDRSRWDRAMIREGVGLVERVLPLGEVGPFQIQAAIAAVHAEAQTWNDTDWKQITILYRMLEHAAPSPMVTLNLGVAVGMAHSPSAGLAVVEPLLGVASMRRHHRLHAVRAHLLEMAGRSDEAQAAYAMAARLTASVPEQRYLNARSERAASSRMR
jgi:RNA polymerase sigma factor (sigma-70 family)